MFFKNTFFFHSLYCMRLPYEEFLLVKLRVSIERSFFLVDVLTSTLLIYLHNHLQKIFFRNTSFILSSSFLFNHWHQHYALKNHCSIILSTSWNSPHFFYFHSKNTFSKKHVISLILKMKPQDTFHCIFIDFENRKYIFCG